MKSWLTEKDQEAGKDREQEKKGVIEDEMVGCHHWLNGHEFEQTQGDSEGQGSLVCYSSWGCKELDLTYQQTQLSDWTATTLEFQIFHCSLTSPTFSRLSFFLFFFFFFVFFLACFVVWWFRVLNFLTSCYQWDQSSFHIFTFHLDNTIVIQLLHLFFHWVSYVFFLIYIIWSPITLLIIFLTYIFSDFQC